MYTGVDMGVHDIIPPSLLAKQDKQPFLLVKLRLKQKDVAFSLEKVVLRPGTEGDFKVFICLPLIRRQPFIEDGINIYLDILSFRFTPMSGRMRA